jgi:hypothetical protein
VGQVLARQQVIDKTKPLFRTFAHRNGYCAFQFDNRRWLNPKQPVVEQRNLAPVRGCRGGTLGVNSHNGRLKSVGAEAAGLQGFLHPGSKVSDPGYPAKSALRSERFWRREGIPVATSEKATP